MEATFKKVSRNSSVIVKMSLYLARHLRVSNYFSLSSVTVSFSTTLHPLVQNMQAAEDNTLTLQTERVLFCCSRRWMSGDIPEHILSQCCYNSPSLDTCKDDVHQETAKDRWMILMEKKTQTEFSEWGLKFSSLPHTAGSTLIWYWLKCVLWMSKLKSC